MWLRRMDSKKPFSLITIKIGRNTSFLQFILNNFTRYLLKKEDKKQSNENLYFSVYINNKYPCTKHRKTMIVYNKHGNRVEIDQYSGINHIRRVMINQEF
jgi:hypothetical protein